MNISQSYNYFIKILLRIYFVLVPFNQLVVKVIGLNVWKDILYILLFILGIPFFKQKSFLISYLSIVLLIIIWRLIYGDTYLEYITYFLMGIPIYLYFLLIKAKEFDKDCYYIGILMLAGLLWIVFFESHGGYEYTFSKEMDNTTLIRDGEVRLRYVFVSPMSLSQFCWYSTLLILFNPRLKINFKIITVLSNLYILIFCHTRAGILLMLITIALWILFRFFKPKNWIILSFTIVSILLLFFQLFLSANSGKETSISDIERLGFFSSGINDILTFFPFGNGAEYFSTRSGKWLDYENSWLALVANLGFMGGVLALFLIYHLLFKVKNTTLLLFIIPWLIYSSIFPVFQELVAILITWNCIAFTVLEKKVSPLFINFNVKEIK